MANKHIKKYKVGIDSETYAISLVSEPAIEETLVALEKQKEIQVQLANEEKHMVYSAVLIPDKPIYRRSEDDLTLPDVDTLGFYSEIAPCGVIGSFLLDKCEHDDHPFDFKHHYITGALDSGVMAQLFEAMRTKCSVSVSNMNRRRNEPRRARIVPLRIFISVQNGRQHLLAYNPEANAINSYRLDYLSGVKIEEPTPRFDELRETLDRMQKKMWGVNIRHVRYGEERTEHVEMLLRIEADEQYILQRLIREKRCGRVERVDKTTYRFSADVYDSTEMIPWLRSFICRIIRLNFSNRTVENRFKEDVFRMYSVYGLSGGEEK